MTIYYYISCNVISFIKRKNLNNNENNIYLLKQNIELEKNDIKVALCTMGKNENLYLKEFIEYYFKLGVDHIFIYDDNEANEEKMSDIMEEKFKNNVSIFNAKDLSINGQPDAFSKCYNDYKNKFEWFLMLDMDEFLYIINDTLKAYLSNKQFDECDFIKIHWVIPSDNGLIYYDKRPLFERFKPPYFESAQIKSIIRGNISELKYWVHSPYISPFKNVTCNNEGTKIYYKDMNFQYIRPININKAYIIHFKYKSTEEFMKKFKRIDRHWSKDKQNTQLFINLIDYFKINNATKKKIIFIKNKLNISFIK